MPCDDDAIARCLIAGLGFARQHDKPRAAPSRARCQFFDRQVPQTKATHQAKSEMCTLTHNVAAIAFQNHDNFTAVSTGFESRSWRAFEMAMQKRSEASAFMASETAPIHGAVRRDVPPPGFRHFLGTPKASQRFRVFGIDPLEAPELLPKIRGLMNRLSRRMDAELNWPPHADATVERWENPRIPSGYTYLLQFVAHDLVHSAIPLSVAGALGADTANARRTALRLETLFGSGPVGSPFVYAQDAPNDERRTKLRLGRMRWDEKGVEPGCPFRDIARTQPKTSPG